MKPLRITAENLGPYSRFDWEVPPGLTVILGRNDDGDGINSNGAGKTKLLEAIPLALFGPTLSWSDHLSMSADGESCRVELEFEHGGQHYRVRRIYSPKGRGKTALDFEVDDPEGHSGWMPLTQESQAETQRLICHKLGISEETFEHTVFARQGARHFADPSLAPAARKQLLQDALGLELWDQLLEMVRDDARPLRDELRTSEHLIAQWEEELEQLGPLREEMGQLRAAHILAEAALESARKTLNEAKENEVQIIQLQTERDRLRAMEGQLADAEVARAEIKNLEPRIVRYAALVDGVEEAERKLSAMRAAAERWEAAQVERGTLAQHGSRLRAALALKATKCDRCGQPLDAAARKAARESIRAELKDIDARLDTLDALPEPAPKSQLQEAERVVQEGRAAGRELGQCETRLVQLVHMDALSRTPEFEAEYHATRLRVERLLASVGEEEDFAEKLQLARQLFESAVEDERHLGEQVARFEERVDALVKLDKRLTAERRKLEDGRARLALLDKLERAYGRDGIPALILESSAIPQIEAEAERVLQALGVPFRIRLDTQRETKSGTVKDTLDVVVLEPRGARRYETYSGGERTRLELALRIGLARLLAHRRGAEIGMFALDEVAYLDRAGLSQLASVLRELTDEFSSILLISHDEDLRDAFDHSVQVIRSNGVSKLSS